MGRRSKSTRLFLWMNGIPVGTWEVDSTGKHQLTYDDSWLELEYGRPVSLSMPLRLAAPYSGDVVRNFFENLLPDNRVIRERLQARFQTPSTSAQDLLAEIGRDCVGALALLPEGRFPDGFDRIEGEQLSEGDIEQALERVTDDRRQIDDHDFRISIAGAQEKTAFLRADGRWMRPMGATPTTHIFKLPLGIPPSGIDLSTSVENEWLCARILDAYEVPVAMGEIAQFGRLKVLVVPRFDRQPSSDGTWIVRLPQEDFAQICGVGPDAKYEADGGPVSPALSSGCWARLARLRTDTTSFEPRCFTGCSPRSKTQAAGCKTQAASLLALWTSFARAFDTGCLAIRPGLLSRLQGGLHEHHGDRPVARGALRQGKNEEALDTSMLTTRSASKRWPCRMRRRR